MPRVVSFIVLLAVIILIGSLFFQVMVQFIVPLFLAAVLVVIFKPLHLWVLSKLDHRPRVAAAVTTFLIVLIVLLPLSATLVRAVSEAAEHYATFGEGNNTQAETRITTTRSEPKKADSKSTEKPSAEEETVGSKEKDKSITDDASAGESAEAEGTADAERSKTTVDKNSLLGVVDAIVPRINEQLEKFDLGEMALKPDDVRNYLSDTFEQMAAPLALGGVRALVSTLFGLAIMVLTLYYFFADGPNMIVALMKLSPMDDEYEQELLDKFASVSRSVVVAVLLSAIAQGILAGIGYFFAGVENVFLCTVLTAVFAMVPFVGATVVWVPICLVLYFYVGSPQAAIVLAIYCTVVVSMVDNLIKPLVLHGQANLHPLLALLSVIGGIQVLGPIGILVGPMLVAFLQALLNMLNKELKLLGQESDATGKPIVFATDAAVADTQPLASLPKSAPAKKSKRKRKK